jgi:hypothetical protein
VGQIEWEFFHGVKISGSCKAIDPSGKHLRSRFEQYSDKGTYDILCLVSRWKVHVERSQMWIPTRIGFDQAEAINPAEVIVQQHEPGKHRSDLVGWGDQGELVERFTHLKPTIATQNEQEPKAPAQNCRNWTVRFCKPDDLILSRLMTVRGTAGL